MDCREQDCQEQTRDRKLDSQIKVVHIETQSQFQFLSVIQR